MSQPSSFDLENDDGLRRLLYLSALLLFFMPYFQAMAGLWPLQLTALQWRFQATGAMSGILMLPFLGLVLALTVARQCGHKGIARIVGVIAALTVFGIVCAIGLFGMDALQLKKVVRDVQMPAFNKAVFTATCTLLFSMVTFGALSFVALRSPKGMVTKSSSKSSKKGAVEEPVGLLIGQNYTKE